MAVCNEPAPRYAHVAAVVEGKFYVWGGSRKDLPEIHDGPAKTAITSVVDVLDLQVKSCTIIIIACWLQTSGVQDLLWQVMISAPDVVSRDQT